MSRNDVPVSVPPVSSIDEERTTTDDEEDAVPKRYIYNEIDMQEFKNSQTKEDLLRVIMAMGKACGSSSSSSSSNEEGDDDSYNPAYPLQQLSPGIASLHGSLTCMHEHWMNDFPPATNSGRKVHIRFGNPMFKEWYHQRLVTRSKNIIRSVLMHHDDYIRNHNKVQEDDYDQILQKASDSGYQAAAGRATPPPGNDDDDDNKKNTSNNELNIEESVVIELASYLNYSFGHPIRLDYGTGHESSFMVLLYCLCKLGIFDENSSPPTATSATTTSSTSSTTTTEPTRTIQPPSIIRLKFTTISIFTQYVQCCRNLQTKYRLEPAGSHGVWGLDDYYCLSFYFGACQLHNQEEDYHPTDTIRMIKNNNNYNNSDADEAKHTITDKYLYFSSIKFIMDIKKNVPFFESSPMLFDISQTQSTWKKISSGLLKLYKGEVLHKRQVVQHFTFGKLFKASWNVSQEPRNAPASTFRDNMHPTAVSALTMPGTRAPWAN